MIKSRLVARDENRPQVSFRYNLAAFESLVWGE
jgi:hypothetical protein